MSRLRAAARAALRWTGWPARVVLLGLVGAYRIVLSPLTGGRCRFHPSCSAYAGEAVRVHGAAKGSLLAIWRVARCSPLSAGGLDPVPDHGRWRSASEYDDVILSATMSEGVRA